MPWCSAKTHYDTAGDAATATDGSKKKAWIPRDAVWPGWKDKKEIYVTFWNVNLLAKWTIGDGQPMNTDTIIRYANTWSDMGGGKIPRFIEAKHGEQAQIRVSFNSMS